MTLTLFVADDHPIVREGLRAVLETDAHFKLVGQAADGRETIRLVEELRPDVLVLDLMMPGLEGLEVIRQVARRSPRTRVVVLSMHANEAYVVAALGAGALGYVLKGSPAGELITAIRAVASGKRYFSAPISEKALERYMQKSEGNPLDLYNTLTSREQEVLFQTAKGLSGLEIAKCLFISPRTVESHRANLMRKLGVRNQKELVRYAIERGLVPSEHPPAAGRQNEQPKLEGTR